eukprot:SM000005S17166  [mRNA]  locus=s5:533472:535422:- [translate_table: standard]
MVYAVTGATGFLGEHLVAQLVGAGHAVRALARNRPPEPLPANAEFVEGSVLDGGALQRALDGAEGVFHLAGAVELSRRPGAAARLREAHVEGTLAVLAAAKAAGARRVVYASTSGVVAVGRLRGAKTGDGAPLAREATARWPYYAAKIEAEEAARSYAAAQGLDLVCMRPSLLLGPGDRRLSACRSVVDIMDRKVPFVPSGELSFVDVRDAAAAFATAMALPGPSPSPTYLLASHNMFVADFFARVARLAGVEPPSMRLPDALVLALSIAAASVTGLLGRWDPSLDPVVVEMSQHCWGVDSSRAQADLGFVTRPAEVTLADTVEWLKEWRAAEHV